MGDDSGQRVRALDGLRGIAALVVLVSHLLKAGSPALSETMILGGDPSGATFALTRTPLATLWAGSNFVIVFFVLSGLVLTRSLIERPVSARAFWSGRIVRLYLPAWLALLPAAALLLVDRRATGGAGVGFWLDRCATPLTGTQLLRDLALVTPQPGDVARGTLNCVLWSLRWEILFSLALPLLLLAAPQARRVGALLVLGAVLCVWGSGSHQSLMFLPPFVIGMALALHWDAIARWRRRAPRRGAWLGLGLATCLLSADWWLPDALPASGPGGALVVVGATLAVLLPLVYESVARPLRRPVVQWLGSRSFSLYLMHHPIVLAFAFGLDRPSLPLLVACAAPASLLAAEIFHRAVERPAHRLARTAVRQVQGQAERRAPVRAATAP